MKKNSKSEIEKKLTPNCEFHASKSLKEIVSEYQERLLLMQPVQHIQRLQAMKTMVWKENP